MSQAPDKHWPMKCPYSFVFAKMSCIWNRTRSWLEAWWLGLGVFTGLIPVWELRSCKLHGTAKINKEINRLIFYTTFEACLLSIGRMHLPLIHVVLLASSFFIAVHYFNPVVIASCFSIHQLRDVWVVFHFWQLLKSFDKPLCTGFCVNIGFHFTWVNAEQWNFWLVDKHMFNFIKDRNCRNG